MTKYLVLSSYTERTQINVSIREGGFSKRINN